MTALPGKARLIITGTAVAGAVTLVVAALAARDALVETSSLSRAFGNPLYLVTLTVLLGVCWVRPLMLQKSEGTEALQLDEAFLVGLALLVPAAGVVAAFAVAATVSQVLLRRPLSRVVFNVAQATAASGVALAAMHAVGFHSHSAAPANLALAASGSLVFLAVNRTLVSAVIAAASGEPFAEIFVGGLTFHLRLWVVSVSVGLLGGLGAEQSPLALILAAAPVGLGNMALRSSLESRRDRERVDGLFRAAMAAHASMEPADVEGSLAAAAAELLQASASAVRAEPAGADEMASLVAEVEGHARWLVVNGRRAGDIGPFDDQDARVLDALAAIGASALQNAHLLDRLRHQALHDDLTGLPNDVLFEERLSYALEQRKRRGDEVAVLFLDLDRFKNVNDAFGHAAGNGLLIDVAARLCAALREGDTVARLGGDEFCVLLPGIASASEAALVATKLLEALRTPFDVAGTPVFATTSIGVAVTPRAGATPVSLMKNADAAMYQAKQLGRNTFQVFVADEDVANRRLVLEAELHAAVTGGDLAVYYQPQVAGDGTILGVEALVRWPHATRGLVPPDDFIPIAEEIGIIADLDAFVLAEACAAGRRWLDAGLPLRVAVNLSGQTVARHGLVATVVDVLAATGLPASALELEVTESIAIDPSSTTLDALRALRDLGVHLAIDDFGTGYSMLARLRDFPVDTLKIDRAFVAEIEDESSRAPIIIAMIAMARGLGLDVVAEGVETAAQWEFLRARGCDRGQGWLFSRPVSMAEIVAYAERQTGSSVAVK